MEPRDPRARPWFDLLDDEQDPMILDAIEPTLVVWSSLWPSRPNDVVRFELRDAGTGTAARWTLETPDDAPNASKTGHLRYRMNYLIFGSLQMSYGH